MEASAAAESKALTAYAARDDLANYGSNGLLLFSLQLRYGVEDIDGVAANALTDGADDKKCDLVYVDRGAGRVIVAQGYLSENLEKTEAPANKASDLNTAAGWLIAGDLGVVPENLRSAAQEVRDAIANDEIREFEIWYSHNLPESVNVGRELDVAVATADSLIKRHFADVQVNCSAIEIGRDQLDEFYRRTEAPIAVTDEFDLEVNGGFEVTSDRWRAFTTSVPATWLREIWATHNADLMSPNVRDYLGMTRSERNINNGIQSTARETPGEFWIYNNGLTVLVHSYVADGPRDDGTWRLIVTGLGIVNGAQTTGSIGTLADGTVDGLDAAEVLTRFVVCEDEEVLADIIRFNNTQNKVEAADFRSKDPVQERLRAEFEGVPDADYRGARRGGVKAAIERSRNLLADSAVAQSLAAFHLEPNLAYNETRRIWVDDGTYARFYSDRTTARHIVLTFSLLRAIEATKKRLSEIPEEGRTESQRRQMAFFRRRGSPFLLLAAVSASIETFLGRPVADRWTLTFAENCAPADATDRWQPIVEAALAFSQQLSDATDLGLKNPETVRAAIEDFQGLIEATAESNRAKYDEFAAGVT
jgi:AIPR protein